MTKLKHCVVPIFAVCAVLLGDSAEADPVTDFYVEVAKSAVEQTVAFGLGEIYDASCSTPDNPVKLDAISSFGCAIARAGSGRAEQEYKNEVLNGLSEINEVVKNIEDKVILLSKGQSEIMTALERIEAQIQVVPIETVAEIATTGINDAWASFLPIMNGTEQATPQEMIVLANRIVNEYKIADKLRTLSGAVAEPTLLTKPSLLQQQMSLLLTGMETATSTDLILPHQFYQGVMRNILVQHGRGEMMYAWAASVLEAVCTEGDADQCVKPQVSLANFEIRSATQKSAMLLHYRDMVERLVLAHSNPGSVNRNFLHEDALRVFAELDFFLAQNLPSHEGLRGRVISAGSSFSGEMTISGVSVESEKPRDIESTREIDWWTRPAINKPYDRVHFAKGWRIHDIVLDAQLDKDYEIEGSMPWQSGDFRLRAFDRQTGELADADAAEENILPFGTFTAISRAGGAFAMMNEAWAVFGEPGGNLNMGTRTYPAIVTYDSGNVRFNPHRFGDESAGYRDFDTDWVVRRRSNITLVDGGNITFNGIFGDAEAMRAGQLDQHRNAKIASDSVLHMHVNFRPSVLSKQSKMLLRSGVFFAHDKGENMIGWLKEETITKAIDEPVSHENLESKTVKYNPGTVLRPYLRAQFQGRIYANGYIDPTEYTLFSGVAPRAIYLTR